MTSYIVRTAPMISTLGSPLADQPGTVAIVDLPGRLRRVLADCLERVVSAADRRRAERDLHDLDDHMLADIGLRRADLPSPRRWHDFAMMDQGQACGLDFAARQPIRRD